MPFNRAQHIKYWRMCANVLPDHYISSDASRVFLGFFIVAGLDLLDVLHSNPSDGSNDNKSVVSPTERQAWIDWIYSCQTPDGAGFRGFTGTNLDIYRNTSNSHWDPGNLPNTFFALAALLILGDDLARVKRREILEWLPRLQREDGSFGEILGLHGQIEGGRDLRYCCCAAGIAYILNPTLKHKDGAPSFDEEKLVSYILGCQDYSGGFGESPLREPHSGLNYCAVATLELVSRLGGSAEIRARETLNTADLCRRWMIQRQTDVLYDEDSEEEEDREEDDKEEKNPNSHTAEHATQNSVLRGDSVQLIGFNGRPNKIADTCYCFWNAGALSLLDSLHLADLEAVRNYLLEKTQHIIGGFGKGPDSPPDVMHSYLGLAALALYGHDGIKEIDPALCISREAAARIERIDWQKRGQ